jgi:aminoglycoside phosphotransferase (APT) family kinase protein
MPAALGRTRPSTLSITSATTTMVYSPSHILAYLEQTGWFEGKPHCRFLAAGEYNENHLITVDDDHFVLRINHGTQLGITNQIEYEFAVLGAVAASTVTPLPYRCDPDAALGNGVMLMEYIEGQPLDYRHDLPAAADIFARIHALIPDETLLVQDNPARDLAAESYGLLSRHPVCYYHRAHGRLLRYHDEIIEQFSDPAALGLDEGMCIVNTEVNSGNFLINAHRPRLVDWEKAVVSCRYQDLAHFVAPTTTLWKRDYRLSDAEVRDFLRHYLAAGAFSLSLDEVYEKTRRMERVVLLRALSWCFMAYHEYRAADKPLTHDDTMRTITTYLDEMQCFLG